MTERLDDQGHGDKPSASADLFALYTECFYEVFPGSSGPRDEPVLQVMVLQEFARRLYARSAGTRIPAETFWQAWSRIAPAFYVGGKVPPKGWMVDLAREVFEAGTKATHSARTSITAEQLAEVENQCEMGLQVEHECPAMFALAAIYADLFTKENATDATTDRKANE